MVLTKEQQEFLINHREVFEKVIPLKKQELEEKERKIMLDGRNKQITDDSEKKKAEQTKKRIKQMVSKMTLADIKKFEELISDEPTIKL